MLAFTRKALGPALACLAIASAALALPGADPLWGFAPADSSGWRGDTLSIAVRTGETGRGSFLLENEGSDPVGPLTLQLASGLHSESGGYIPESAVIFNPVVIAPLDSAAARSISLEIVLPASTPPAFYHGRVQALLPDSGVFDEFILELATRSGERLRVAPNPAYGDRHRNVEFRIATEAGMNVDIDIFTAGMDKVRTLYGDGPWSGDGLKILRWDMTNESGHPVASGMYVALARYELGGERFTETQRVLLIR